MKIERIAAADNTIEKFAELHDLTLLVSERDGKFVMEYTTSFKEGRIYDTLKNDVEITGSGESEEAAIYRFAKNISGRVLQLYSGQMIKIPHFSR